MVAAVALRLEAQRVLVDQIFNDLRERLVLDGYLIRKPDDQDMRQGIESQTGRSWTSTLKQ